MPDYRRHHVPGGTYFFTVNLFERNGSLLTAHIEALRQSVKHVRHRQPFAVDAWVVLPDHMHCIWTLPPCDADYPSRWKSIKTTFAKHLPKTERLSAVRKNKGERGIWQRRFWEHTIRDERDYAAHVDYVHVNPMNNPAPRGGHRQPYKPCRSSSDLRRKQRGIRRPSWILSASCQWRRAIPTAVQPFTDSYPKKIKLQQEKQSWPL